MSGRKGEMIMETCLPKSKLKIGLITNAIKIVNLPFNFHYTNKRTIKFIRWYEKVSCYSAKVLFIRFLRFNKLRLNNNKAI